MMPIQVGNVIAFKGCITGTIYKGVVVEIGHGINGVMIRCSVRSQKEGHIETFAMITLLPNDPDVFDWDCEDRTI